jgi:starvation-inducible DNA-binding protein
MTFRRNVLENRPRQKVAVALGSILADLVDLALQLKQAHWTLVGPGFRSLHLALDEAVAAVREAADAVAERLSTLGVAPDGRVATVVAGSRLSAYPEGFVPVPATVSLTADRLETAIAGVRRGIAATAEPDPVSQDLLIEVCAGLEKHLWMIQAEEPAVEVAAKSPAVSLQEAKTAKAKAGKGSKKKRAAS